ncbi:transglycosylase domain-containing protein [Natronosporangium hydrolyticum]|uniref:Transglycosylase domain-containing protein n=1 Tax=Natronosporangium hydrolyticum TaxID=2811111 RepID=A0A895YLP0_9ACTN|nr:transglycosylase domain-containing protein [Natronosporangium hydrolyticum]QSB14798.1 transglycosylase domain-containing protein [Natronosporangium hydrolyticum]
MSSYDHPQSYRRTGGSGAAYDDAYDEYGQYQDAYTADSYGADPYPADSYSRDPYARDSYQPEAHQGRGGRPQGAASRDEYARDPYPSGGYSRGGQRHDDYEPTGSGRVVSGQPAGRASVARAAAPVSAGSAGRASVPVPTQPAAPDIDHDDPHRPRYDWSGGAAAGAAAAPTAPAAGRAVAGRATVPVSPGAGPAAPGSPAGRASVRPSGPAGGGPSKPGAGAGDGEPKPPRKKKKRHWLRNSALTALAVLVIISGGGMVALSYYVESVPPPEDFDLEEASTIFYADNSEMAVMQEVNREIIDTKVPELQIVRDAVVAAEDNDFFDHSGVDFMGIMRAAVNNMRGGPRQGASTIDQQYVGVAADIRSDASYSRKMEEAAMAYKMNQDYSKLEILDFYLNTIYFGRGAYGIQAAAQSYFGKEAQELDASEAAVLAGVIRLPDDQSGLSPYDPRHSPDDQQIAIDRWNYVMGQMVATGVLTPEERAEFTELPEAINPDSISDWHEGPQGNIVRQVRRELEAMGIEDLTTGGYRITTTIDPAVQEAALDAVRRQNDAAHWEDLPENVDAAMVAVNPEDGAVLAYYGGEDGTAFDMAGKNWNEAEQRWEGGRPPGSTFKIYTLLAAIREGVSVDSHWRTSEYDPGFGRPIENAGRDARETGCDGIAPDYCTLAWSTVESFNVPFFHFAEAVPNGEGPARILEAARDSGIQLITGTSNDGDAFRADPRDLTEIEDLSSLGREPFDYHVSFGMYPVTVLDHASGVATLANSGIYNEPHFVAKVEQRIDGEWQTVESARINGQQRIEPAHADAVTGVLTEVPGSTGVPLDNGRIAAAKTGTWEHDNGGNADAWMVGYTPQIAAAVWVGDAKGDPILDQFGNNIGSSGLPSQIWKQFMDAAHAAKELQNAEFPQPLPVGDPNHQFANGEQPQQETREPGDPRCRLPHVSCPEPDDDEDRGDDNGDPGNGDDNGDENGGGGNIGVPQPPPPGFPGDEGDDGERQDQG